MTGIIGHSGVTGHDTLVTVEMVRRRGVPRRQCRLEKRTEEGQGSLAMAPFPLWTLLTHPLPPSPIEILLVLCFVFQSRTFHEHPKFHIQGGLDGA